MGIKLSEAYVELKATGMAGVASDMQTAADAATSGLKEIDEKFERWKQQVAKRRMRGDQEMYDRLATSARSASSEQIEIEEDREAWRRAVLDRREAAERQSMDRTAQAAQRAADKRIAIERRVAAESAAASQRAAQAARLQIEDSARAAAGAQSMFGTATRAAASATSGYASAANRAAYTTLELGRAAEDAAIGFGISGWQGAMRGSLNNLTQIAMITGGPLVGGIAAIGGAAAAAALGIGRFADETDRAEAALEQADKFMEEIGLKIEHQQELAGGRQDVARAQDSGAAADIARQQQDDIDNLEVGNRELQAQLQEQLFFLRFYQNDVAALQAEADSLADQGWEIPILNPTGRSAVMRSLEIQATELENARARVEELNARLEENVQAQQRLLAVRDEANRRAGELAQSEAFANRVGLVGDIINRNLNERFPEFVIDMGVNLERADGQLRDWMAGLEEEAAKAMEEEQSYFSDGQKGFKGGPLKTLTDAAKEISSRGPQFGGIADLARHLQQGSSKTETLLADGNKTGKEMLKELSHISSRLPTSARAG